MTYSICGYLRPKIREYVEARNESLRWFSRQTGVDNTTIYRLADGGQKSLSFRNACKIVRMLEPIRYLSILADFYPNETKELKSAGLENSDALSAPLANQIALYRVFLYAVGKKASREQIKDKYGSDGLEQIAKMTELGILSEVDGRFYDNLDGLTFPSEEVIKRFASHNYELISLDIPGSAAENFRGGLSADGFIEWYNAIQECISKLHKILCEKAGDIVIAGSIITGPVEENK